MAVTSVQRTSLGLTERLSLELTWRGLSFCRLMKDGVNEEIQFSLTCNGSNSVYLAEDSGSSSI